MSDDTTTTDDAGSSGNAEAAKYRRRLREVEAERDALSATLLAARRRDVERHARGHLADVDDAWTIGQWNVDEMLGEDGLVDDAKVAAATSALIESRPRLAKGEDISGDFDGGARSSASRPSADWQAILSGRSR